MLTMIFSIMMIMVFGKLIILAIRASWAITKVLFSIVFLPFIIIGLFMAGLVYLAIPILAVVGIVALLDGAV